MAAQPQLHWFQHREGGAVHGFTLPLPPDLQAQVTNRDLLPCDAPTSVRTLELSPEQIDALTEEDLKTSKSERRARLKAMLAALGDEDDDETDGEPESSPGPARADAVPGDVTASKPRGGRRA